MPEKYWSQLSLSGKTAAIMLLGLLVMAILAPWLTTHPADRSSGPAFAPPGSEHWLGTDQLGVDLWSMICYGARVSLLVGVGTAFLAGFGGGILGMLSAWKGGWVDRLMMRVVDLMLALPELPVMIVLAAFFGSSIWTIILVLALFSWSIPARIVRASALSLKEQPYINMAKHYGAGTWYILRKHFIPELFPLVIISMIRLASMAIVTEASLAFLGLGDPASRSWGLIINHAVNFRGIYFTEYWTWWLLYPWLFLTILVTSLALFGREMEKVADPRMGRIMYK